MYDILQCFVAVSSKMKWTSFVSDSDNVLTHGGHLDLVVYSLCVS